MAQPPARAGVSAAASFVGAGTSRQHLEHGPSCEVSPAWTQTAQPSTGPTAAAFHGRPATAAAPSTPRESSGGASLGLPAPAPAARGARLRVGGAPVAELEDLVAVGDGFGYRASRRTAPVFSADTYPEGVGPPTPSVGRGVHEWGPHSCTWAPHS